MNLGFQVSLSHAAPNTLKTNAPNTVLWDVIRTWTYECNPSLDATLREPARLLISKPRENWTPNIKFNVRLDANPMSREAGILRYQQNLSFGPGVRSTFSVGEKTQKKRKRKHSVVE